jgi:N-acetylmuramoyl-L-alanine amidase
VSLARVAMPSPFYSARGGSAVRLIVLHATEGAQTIEALGSWFQNPSARVSSHTGIDNVTAGRIGEYVPRSGSAWTAAGANGVAVQTELCTPSGASSGWSAADWQARPIMLANTAAWIAEEAAAFGIPIVRLSAAQAQGGAAGVCQHADLGAWGGGHYDLGPNFPIDQVIAQAAAGGGAAPPPQPTPSTSGENMILVDPVTGGTWCIASTEGAVNAYGGAPYLGATNNTTANAARYPCVGIGLRPNNDGYRIVLDWGDAGNGKSADGGDRFRTYNFPRDGSGVVRTGTY